MSAQRQHLTGLDRYNLMGGMMTEYNTFHQVGNKVMLLEKYRESRSDQTYSAKSIQIIREAIQIYNIGSIRKL